MTARVIPMTIEQAQSIPDVLRWLREVFPDAKSKWTPEIGAEMVKALAPFRLEVVKAAARRASREREWAPSIAVMLQLAQESSRAMSPPASPHDTEAVASPEQAKFFISELRKRIGWRAK